MAAANHVTPHSFHHANERTIQQGKRDWQADIDLVARRTVLLHILMLLKSKYGKVDTKISYIARRAELALYSQAFSAREYRNLQTLSRRLHSLVVKLHLNNLTEKENEAFSTEETHLAFVFQDAQAFANSVITPKPALLGKRPMTETVMPRLKKLRTLSKHNFKSLPGTCSDVFDDAVVSALSTNSTSRLFFDGNNDLVRHVCIFLSAKDVLRTATTCVHANSLFPAFVTTIQVTIKQLQRLSLTNRMLFFRKFPQLQHFSLDGEMTAQQVDFQNEMVLINRNVICRSLLNSLSQSSLPKLASFELKFAYTEGLRDQITSQVATVLLGPESAFPQLRELSLVGNCIADDGVLALSDALTWRACNALPLSLTLLNLENNFIGERGHLQMEETVKWFASSSWQAQRGAPIVIKMRGNLLTPPSA